MLAGGLRAALASYPGHDPPHLDARGMLLFVPLVVLLAGGVRGDALVPCCGRRRGLPPDHARQGAAHARWLRVMFALIIAAILHHHGVGIETARLPLIEGYWELVRSRR